MSRAVLLANFLVMVVLSLIAGALVVFPPAPPAGPEPLLPEFDPSAIRVLEAQAGDDTLRLARDQGGQWTLAWGSDPQVITRWPVAETRVRPALRLLAEATLTPGQGPTGEPAARLSIAGGQASVVLGDAVAAGRVPASITVDGRTRTGLTDERLHAIFARAGLLAWRDDRAMPGVARDPVHVLVSATTPEGEARVELSRIQGRWGLIGEVVERADAGVVQASIDALARVTVARFRDDLDPRGVGLARPRVMMEVRGGRAEDAYSWRIEIGDPASADGNQVYAALSGTRGAAGQGETFGPVYVVLGLDALASVYASPGAYLATTSLATPAADIRRFTLRTPDAGRAWTYERGLDAWRVASPGAAAPRNATPAEAAAIAGALELLTNAPADRASLDAPAGLVVLATLDVEGASGLAAESITLGRIPGPPAAAGGPPSAPLLVVGTAGAWRTYGPMPESLTTLLPIAP